MDEAIRNALKKKRELEFQLEKIAQFIALYEELTGTKVAQDEMISQGDSSPEKSKPVRIRLDSSKKFASPAKIAEVAQQLIREVGTPIRRGKLVSLLEERGLRINSDDKARYLGTILWRHKDQFTNIEGKGYWLNELGEPPEE